MGICVSDNGVLFTPEWRSNIKNPRKDCFYGEYILGPKSGAFSLILRSGSWLEDQADYRQEGEITSGPMLSLQMKPGP